MPGDATGASLQAFRAGHDGLQNGAVVIEHRFSSAWLQYVVHAVPAKHQLVVALHDLMIQPDLRRLGEHIAGFAKQMAHCPIDSHPFQRHPQHAGKDYRHERLTL